MWSCAAAAVGDGGGGGGDGDGGSAMHSRCLPGLPVTFTFPCLT